MTTSTTTLASPSPDQSSEAERRINDAIFQEAGVTSHATARLIAAALHAGEDTALHHFAATGQFDPDTLSAEVARLRVPRQRESWRRLLLLYVFTSRGSHPWRRSFIRQPRRGLSSHPRSDPRRKNTPKEDSKSPD